VDEAYLSESIRQPGASVVEGYSPGAMPSFTWLTEEQVEALVAFIKSRR
jgi:cytochrome c oxidase subunit 2